MPETPTGYTAVRNDTLAGLMLAEAEVERLREATPNAKLAAEVERLREQIDQMEDKISTLTGAQYCAACGGPCRDESDWPDA